MKQCYKCGLTKDNSEFFKSKINKDGLYGYCKLCAKEITKTASRKWRSKNREALKEYRDTFDWKRYYDKRKLLRLLYPEKLTAQYISRNIPVKDGFDKHHWSYNEEHRLDITYLPKSIHRMAHRNMIYDQERMMFRKLDGVLLDSKEMHLEYINNIVGAIDKCYLVL